MRLMGNVARMGEMRNAYTQFWLESLKQRNRLENLDVNIRMILKWILGCGMVSSESRWGLVENRIINWVD
jgi:hypothetical protein